MKRAFAFGFIASAWAGLTLAAPASAEESAYGCVGLHQDRTLETIEGRDGMFFRVAQDIMMQRRYSDRAVDAMGALSAALETRGTRLVVALVPTKAVVVPHLLPEKAEAFGFDFDTAVFVQRNIQHRLEAAGVTTVDLWPAMHGADKTAVPFFGTDTHWNAHGAELAASAIAQKISADPFYDALPKTQFSTTAVGPVSIISSMRRIIQMRCRQSVPEATTTLYETAVAQPLGAIDIGLGDGSLDIGLGDAPLDIGLGDAPLDIGLGDAQVDIGLDDAPVDIGLGDAPLDIGLGDAPLDIGLGDAPAVATTRSPGQGLPIALVGTSFSDIPEVNFPGFLAQHSSLETVNYAITGGGLYSAITSYLTSDDFQSNPPAFLVWEAPVYLNPMNDGDQPMRELVAAASGTCRQPVALQPGADGQSWIAALPQGLSHAETLFLDTGSRATREVAFRFTAPSGRTRTKSILRGDRARLNGRFYMPLSGLWSEGAATVEITATTPFGASPRLFTCTATPS